MFQRSTIRLLVFAISCFTIAASCLAQLQPITLSKDGRCFERSPSGQRFIPWGHNYAPTGKLIEDVWDSDWDTIVQDFQEMRDMGANVARVHLQVSHFMESPNRPHRASLERFAKLIRLAEDTGIYLDVTGLGCYRSNDVPKWYDELSQADRWRAQGRFWSAIAEVGATSPAIFCYDLINEPIVPGQSRKQGEWYSGKLFGGYDFVQFIALEASDRRRYEVAVEWIKALTHSIRLKDKQHLITVGLLPSTKKWGHLSGFVPERVAPELDFLSVHIYPESGKLDEARDVVRQFAVGKPLVIEETFNLSCSTPELRQFLLDSRASACGWIGHYGGQTVGDFEALKQSDRLTIPQALMGEWLDLFRDLRPQMMELKAQHE